jgi:hypothetical protein
LTRDGHPESTVLHRTSATGKVIRQVKARPFTIDGLRAYLVEIFPEFWKDGDLYVEDIAPMSATVRLIHHSKHLRPGGTISGPAMFAVCDVAIFVAILGEIGPVAHAITTSASINSSTNPRPPISSAWRR